MKNSIRHDIRLKYQLLLCLFIIIFQASVNMAFAQIEENTARDSLMIKYNIDVSAIIQTGRISQVFIPVGAMAVIGNNSFELEVPVKYMYHKIGKPVLENDLITRAVIKFFPNQKIYPVVGYIYEFSQLYNLKYRHAPGIGIGLKLLNKGKNTLIFHIFTAYDQTEFENITGYQTFRINNILWGEHILAKDKINIEYALFFFHSLNDETNYMYRFEPKLLFKLTRRMSFTLNLDYRYENIVDPMNEEENIFFSAGMRFSGGIY